MSNPHQMQYRHLMTRLRKFGVEIAQHKGKGSEVVLIKPSVPGSKKGPQATIGHHGDNGAVSPKVINSILRRLQIDRDAFWNE